ncbi:hypothetical protein V6N13_147322 [Hibiscus sabdariffa]
MSIRNCQRIEEILEDRDDDDHHNEISFLQLNRLELEDLPKPESFCSSQNYTFEFPSLEILLLVNCPKMKMFSQGDLKTLILQKVRLDEWGTEEHSGGNLNSTIYNNYSDQRTAFQMPLVISHVKEQMIFGFIQHTHAINTLASRKAYQVWSSKLSRLAGNVQWGSGFHFASAKEF